jgi:hypothetical protein
MNNRSKNSSALTIQRIFRGAQVRFFQPRQEQMMPSVLGHTSIGNNLDRINKESLYWSSELTLSWMNEVGFNTHHNVKTMDTEEVVSGFASLKDGHVKSSFIFAKAIDAAFSQDPVYPFFLGPSAADLDTHFKKTIALLEKGVKVVLWDGHSTKIPASKGCLEIVKVCFVKYNFFMGNTIPEPSLPPLDDLEERLKKLMASSNFSPGQCTTRSLARPAKTQKPQTNASTNIAADDLEERMQRLLNLPSEVIYLAEPASFANPINAFVIQ